MKLFDAMEKQNAAQEAVERDLAIEAQGWTATKNGGFWCAIGRKISTKVDWKNQGWSLQQFRGDPEVK